MSTLNATLPTLADIVKRMDPNGAIANIVETLQQRTPLLEDMVWQEGNLPTGHRVTTRTGLPTPTWRRFNEGVAPQKSRTDQFDEACGMMTDYSVVDVQEAKLNGNEAAFRASEDQAFLMAYRNALETAMFYSSTYTNPEKIMGLAPRLNATTVAASSQLIRHTSGASGSDQTSIWLVAWSPQTVFGIFPKGDVGGLQHIDRGIQLWTDSGGTNKFTAYVTEWIWKCGLVVKDWRYLVRIGNIDTSAISATNFDLVTTMIQAYHQMQDTHTGRLAWYCNRTVGTYLHLQALNKTYQNPAVIESVSGKPVLTFLGIPVRETDALLNTEAVIS